MNTNSYLQKSCMDWKKTIQDEKIAYWYAVCAAVLQQNLMDFTLALRWLLRMAVRCSCFAHAVIHRRSTQRIRT
ncbi:Hypothetical predicted protein [Olea europaea subsp. europaea]|uniref:Uncharacterized protein n=1 Tax=Olea europaea subsp. europaea TaxID=158383 RepID=A0A8S0QWC8_OLEEU|nr:Hypothetical predicted protein [Olea europaea subsp. europaea]